MEWSRGDYEVSTDRARLDLPTIYRFLSEEAYWSPEIPMDTVGRAIENSIVFGLYRGTDMAGFARVVTDHATFAWVCDVFVLAEHRGHGLGKFLMECVKSHPDLQGLRRWILATRDAHGLYEQFGFSVAPSGGLMEIRDIDIYRRPRG